jgi:tRNA pseudouridine13 synthase
VFDPLAPLPRIAGDLPGTGGVIKKEPDDFEVEEIPAYEPDGDGEHLYLWIEKRGVPADELVRRVARAARVSPRDVGTAGLKDARAVTRQWVSVPAPAESSLSELDARDLRVLRVARHRNKLRTGHLQGNRFRILVRDVGPDALARAEAIVARLEETGLPNFFGAQRFGRGGETVEIGWTLLRGERSAALSRAPRGRRGFLKRLALSAAQAALFNDFLCRRMADGLLHDVVDGDVMQVAASGGPFIAEELERERARLARREIVVTGPMFGPKMRGPRRAAADRELAVLEANCLAAEAFDGHGKILSGTRRAILIRPVELAVAAVGEGLELRFELPSGSYATRLVAEITG